MGKNSKFKKKTKYKNFGNSPLLIFNSSRRRFKISFGADLDFLGPILRSDFNYQYLQKDIPETFGQD